MEKEETSRGKFTLGSYRGDEQLASSKIGSTVTALACPILS